MSTRALIHFYDKSTDRRPFVTVYRQCDGYPEGLGKELSDLIHDAKIVNGYGGAQAIPKYFNGIGCLAAWVIGQLKGSQIGNVYLDKAGVKDVGEEYTYRVKPEKETGTEWRIALTCDEVDARLPASDPS